MRGEAKSWGGQRTRAADLGDVDALIDLTALAREESPLTTQLSTLEATHLRDLLAAWISLEGATMLVAEVDGKLVGFAQAQLVTPNIYIDVPILHIEGLFVREDFRRRGIARQLLAEVSRIAGENEVEHIVTIALTGSRQELRFLSGLGFAPAGARRVVDTATLNRKLAGPARERRLRGIDELIARRRRSRDLTTTS